MRTDDGRTFLVLLAIAILVGYWVVLPVIYDLCDRHKLRKHRAHLEHIAKSVGNGTVLMQPIHAAQIAGNVVVEVHKMRGFRRNYTIGDAIDLANADGFISQQELKKLGLDALGAASFQALFNAREQILVGRGDNDCGCSCTHADSVRNACLVIASEIQRQHKVGRTIDNIPKAAPPKTPDEIAAEVQEEEWQGLQEDIDRSSRPMPGNPPAQPHSTP